MSGCTATDPIIPSDFLVGDGKKRVVDLHGATTCTCEEEEEEKEGRRID